jgi:hypothetical protein
MRVKIRTLTTFNAKLIGGASDRVYRIYLKNDDLFFILFASGLGANPEALTVHFGLLGALIGAGLKKRAKKKNAATMQRFDQTDPEQLLSEHKRNFKLHASEIKEGAINPPALFAMHGRQAGRWQLLLRDGRKMNFQSETNEDLKAALDLLSTFLNSTLSVNVEWNEKKKRWQKQKTQQIGR